MSEIGQSRQFDLRGEGALFEYLSAQRAVLVTGAAILAGWPAPQPYGRVGVGPRPPRLDAVVQKTRCVAQLQLPITFEPKKLDTFFFLNRISVF